MKKIIQLAAALGALLTVSACSHWNSMLHSCNPLGRGQGEDCLLPYPSSFYTRPDPTSATGMRVDLSQAALPVSSFGTALDPTRFDHRDGFSPVATLLAQFPARIDASNFPKPGDPDRALEPESPVQLFAYDTGERVPLFAELDANADPRSDEQALIIQPVVRLKPKTRYVAVIRGLKTVKGETVAPLSGFRKLRDGGVAHGSALDGEKERFEEIFAFLAKRGFERGKLQLAWDFTTGSDESVVGRLVRMRDEALHPGRAIASRKLPALTIEKVVEKPYPDLLRKIEGKFTALSFLKGGHGDRLNLDRNGEPVAEGYARFPVTIHVPECAKDAKGPLPVVLYGHGTFNSAENEMSTPYSRKILNKLCMIEVGTDWLGRAKADLPYFLLKILPNWNNFEAITDRLQQAHINMVTLAHLVRSGALDDLPELQRDGKPLIDSSHLYYYGISEGGCQGVTTLALSGDIERGALNVPCGFWTMFFSRSSDFYYTRKALKLTYPGPIERQKLLVLSQLLWDYTDPANYGGHLLHDPLPGNTTKKILYQEGINDASVPNLTTRAMARTIGLKLLEPSVETVEGIETARGPQDSGYVQFDVGSRPRLGGNNIPPPKSSVHEEIRRLESAQAQLKSFLREDGKVVPACGDRPCAREL